MKTNQISLLLGAGFSVSRGYPTANKLNQQLLELTPEDFWINTVGVLHRKSKDAENPTFYSSYSHYGRFTIDLIQYYTTIKEFNYEEFYDFYNSVYRGEREDKGLEAFCENFRKESGVTTDNQNLYSQANKVLNQLILKLLVDNEGKSHYRPVHLGKPIYPGYTGFLYCMESFSLYEKVNIHTLNHDIFFEVFGFSDWLKEGLSDGFSEIGSSYYGTLQNEYKVRLPYFADKFDKKYCLYKLHGSIDHIPFHYDYNDFKIETYLKLKINIPITQVYKECELKTGELGYLNDPINYHTDFLSGTTSKILRYDEPVYYNKMFSHFRVNLKNSNKLIVIGYGGADDEVNNIIEDSFDFKNNEVYIVEPYPSERTNQFIERFGVKLLEKFPENMNPLDFGTVSKSE